MFALQKHAATTVAVPVVCIVSWSQVSMLGNVGHVLCLHLVYSECVCMCGSVKICTCAVRLQVSLAQCAELRVSACVS
jgi:hypothetical protein